MPEPGRRTAFARDVLAGLREQRRRRRGGRLGRRGRSLPERSGRGIPGVRAVLVGVLFGCALLLAVSGATIFLVGLFAVAILLWALDDVERNALRDRPIVFAPPAEPREPGHAPAARPVTEETAAVPEPEPQARPAPEPARRPSRNGATLSYEATLAELMSIVGTHVAVEFEAAGGDRGRGTAASRLVGELQAGAVDDEDEQHSGRGLFFAVGSGSGFYLPALEFVWAQRREESLTVRLRTHTLVIETERVEDPARLTRAAP